MSDYNQTRDAAGNVTSQYGQMLRNLDDDLVERLRNTPNWMREGFQDWKDNVRTYDRTPFEAADRIEELETQLSEVRQVGKDWFEEQKKARKDANAAEAKLAKAEGLLVDAMVQLENGKIKTRRNRAYLIGQFLAELMGTKDE